jgi:hypothetical protein
MDQFDLFVLDRVTPHFAAIGVNAAVTVDPDKNKPRAALRILSN